MDKTVDAIDHAIVPRNPMGLVKLAELEGPRYRMCGMVDLKRSIEPLEKELATAKTVLGGIACLGTSGFDLHYHLAKLAVDAKIEVDDDLFDLTFYEILRLKQPKIEEFAVKAASKAVNQPKGRQSSAIYLSPQGIKKQGDSFIQNQQPDFRAKPQSKQRYDGMAKFAAKIASGSQTLLTGLDLSPLEPLCGQNLKPLSATELNNIILHSENLRRVGDYIRTTGALPELQSVSVLADTVRPIAQNLGLSEEVLQQVENALKNISRDGKIPVKELSQRLGDAVQARADPEDQVRQLIQQGLPLVVGVLSAAPFMMFSSIKVFF